MQEFIFTMNQTHFITALLNIYRQMTSASREDQRAPIVSVDQTGYLPIFETSIMRETPDGQLIDTGEKRQWTDGEMWLRRQISANRLRFYVAPVGSQQQPAYAWLLEWHAVDEQIHATVTPQSFVYPDTDLRYREFIGLLGEIKHEQEQSLSQTKPADGAPLANAKQKARRGRKNTPIEVQKKIANHYLEHQESMSYEAVGQYFGVSGKTVQRYVDKFKMSQ